jgi:cytochrome c-type biogenesis protein CcmH/NrfF
MGKKTFFHQNHKIQSLKQQKRAKTLKNVCDICLNQSIDDSHSLQLFIKMMIFKEKKSILSTYFVVATSVILS